jgi:ribulose bisphosphate carboxylase small subunit
MIAREFIVKKLENLIKQYPQTRVRYGYDEIAKAHFIEVILNEGHNNSKDEYLSWEYEMLCKFTELYPVERIYFASADAVGIDDYVELTLYGADYPREQKSRNKTHIVETISIASKEFIVKELENFVKQFPQTRVRYEYNELANVHFIEITPNEVYHSDENYSLWEDKTWDKYVKLYPSEGICFVSDDDFVGVKNAELTLYGAEYAQKQRKKSKKRVAEAILE